MNYQQREASFELNRGMNANKVDEDELKNIIKDINNSYDLNNSDLNNVLKELHFYRKNKTNLNILLEIKNITLCFIKTLEENITKCINEENSKFKDNYAKTIKLKNSKILGSYNKNMYLNNNLNIDIGVEYDLNIKLGKKSKFRNFHVYHNMLINILKNLFYEKDFINNIKELNISSNLEICICVNRWINKIKSVLVLNIFKNRNFIGSINVLLYPTKKVCSSFSYIYKKYYMQLKNIGNTSCNNNNISNNNSSNNNNDNNCNNNSNISPSTEKNKKLIKEEENNKKIDEKEIKSKLNKIFTNKIILNNFILTECHIVECENIIKNTIKNFKGYKKAVKLLKLWCLNKKLLHISKYENNIKFKNSETCKFSNFFYYSGINSFILGLLCSYACFTYKLSNCDSFQIFKKTINFISSINLCENFYEFKKDVLLYMKSEQNNNMQPHAFLINSVYEIFQNNVCSLMELIEEAKKAEYCIKTNNFYELFVSNNNCFPFNYEEELFFPLFINNNFCNYDEKIVHIKKSLIKSLGDRIEELTFRLVSCDFYEKNSKNVTCNNNNDLSKKHIVEALTIFQGVLLKKSKDNEISKSIIKKKILLGVSFFIKTNNTVRCMDVSKNMYKPEKTSNFKKFWSNKVKIRRFENNTISEVLIWKRPGRAINLKKKKKKDLNINNKTKKSSINKASSKVKTECKKILKKKKLIEDVKELKSKENLSKRHKGSGETSHKKEDEMSINRKINYMDHNGNSKKVASNKKKKSMEDTSNFVFDALFSELQGDKNNSVHVQIIKYVLKKMKYKESYDLNKGLHKKIKYLKTNDHYFYCGKKIKNKSFFIYFTNPLLIKDIYFSYYEIIFEYYNELKSIIYNLNEKLFTISNINSSNNLLKMSDLGYKKNNTKIIDVVIDIKFNNNIYKNAENFFKNYEIAKGIIKNKLISDGGSFNKVEQKNFFIDVHYKLIIFRLHIFVSKIIEKSLIQITNLDDVKIDYVENIEKIRNYIYKPLISSFIYFYATKFSSFHISLKICKLWFISKGFYCFDELVENVLFYIYTEEFKKHNNMSQFFEDNNLFIYNKSLKQFLLNSKTLQVIDNFEETLYMNSMIKEKLNGSNQELVQKKNKDYQKPNKFYKNEEDEEIQEEDTDSDFFENKKDEKYRQININKDNSKNNSSLENKKSSIILNLKKGEKENESFLDSFTFSSKTILIKFLKFFINYDWINKPLIIDYDGCLSEEHKIKLINSFIVRKKNNEEEKKFWICSIYDPHSALITLPQNLFDLIINTAKNTLKSMEDLHNNFEREKWFSLFLMEKRKYDIILHFNQADKALKTLKKKMKIAGGKKSKKADTLQKTNEIDGSNIKKEEEKYEEIYNNDEKNIEADENNKDNDDNNIYKMEENYNLDYLEKIKKTNAQPSDMLQNLKKCELLHIYKNHFDSFIKNLEQNFSSHITILYNPLCFDEVLNTYNFRKKLKLKLNKLPDKYLDIFKSWVPHVFITFNPLYINNVEITTNPNNLQNNPISSSIALNNFNLLIYYIKNNAKDILKDVKFPTI